MAQIANQLVNKRKLFKHLRTAFFVGTILNIINQGQFLLRLEFAALDYFKFVLTFFVPFAVSIYSAGTTENKL